jgi:hypothetical protein
MPNFPFASGAARQQQAGDVDARDEQHKADSPHQGEQRGTDVAHHLLLNRDEQHLPAGVALRDIPLQLREDRPHLREGLIEGHSIPQSRNPKRGATSAVGSELLDGLCERDEEIRFLSRHREAGRHDPDDGSRTAIRRQRCADDVRPAAHAGLPVVVVQDDDAVLAAVVFLEGEVPADDRLHAERREHVHRALQAPELFRFAADDGGQAGPADHPDVFERPAASLATRRSWPER